LRGASSLAANDWNCENPVRQLKVVFANSMAELEKASRI